MIVGLGIDLVELARIEKIHAKFGMRFADKILAPAEIAIIPPAPVPFIAGRFAAKEAAVKALGTGFANGISPRDVEISADIHGKPVLSFLANASTLAQLMGVRSSHISITHEKSCAAAVVILEA